MTAKLKRIGEALIEIADGQEGPIQKQVETIRRLTLELTVIIQDLMRTGTQEANGKAGTV